MAMKEYIFSGKAAYCSTNGRDFNDGKGPKWSMRLYPRTAADRKEIKATGIKNKEAIDDGSALEEGLVYFTFRNDKEPYKILDGNGNPVTALVGNGSDVSVKLLVETFNSPKFGPQARSWLTEVVVNNLVPYEPKAPTVEKAELPA